MNAKHSNSWRTCALSDVAEVRTGIAKNEERKCNDPVELPYLRVANVQDGTLDLSEIKTITVERDRVARYSLQQGDVLLTEGGDFDKLGRGAVWRGTINPCLHQNHVFVVRPNQDVLLPEFLSAYCGSERGRRYFLSCSKQTTNLASINSSQLKAMPVPVPAVYEQQRITSLLHTISRRVSLSDQLLRAQYQIYKACLDRFARTALQKRPFKGWRNVYLGDVFTERDETSADLPLLAITARQGLVPRDDIERRDTSAADKSKYKVIRPGDIGYNTMRMWQGVCGLSRHHGIVSPAYTVVEPVEGKILGEFAAHLFRHSRVIHTFRRYSQGLVDDTLLLKFPHFSEIRLAIPDIDKQTAIAAALDAQMAYVDIIKEQGRALRQQKRGLMQKLLSGEWRLTTDLPLPEMAHG